MKLQLEQDVLTDAVVWAARSLPARPPMQVLLGLLLEIDAAAGRLAVSGFDYEMSSRVEVDAVADESARLLVPGRLLTDIVRALPAQPVTLHTDARRLVLNCGPARFTLPTMPAEDYPGLPAMPSSAGSLESDLFAAAVAQVAVAAGRVDTLPQLTGVRLEIEGDVLTLAATDRYRLAVRTLAWKPEQSGMSAVALVPARTLADTAKALNGAAEVVLAMSSGGLGEGMIGFEGGGRRTTTRLIDGEFPKYRSLLPTETAAAADVPRAPFVEAVKRVQLVSMAAARNAPVVRLSFSSDGMVLEAGGADDAQAAEQLECQWEGEPMSIAFNPAYLLDGLSAVDSETTVMSFTAASRPAVLTGKSDPDQEAAADYRYLLMPVRLSG